jgi:hypothetical protein
MFKKIFFITIAAVIIALLSACGGNSDNLSGTWERQDDEWLHPPGWHHAQEQILIMLNESLMYLAGPPTFSFHQNNFTLNHAWFWWHASGGMHSGSWTGFYVTGFADLVESVNLNAVTFTGNEASSRRSYNYNHISSSYIVILGETTGTFSITDNLIEFTLPDGRIVVKDIMRTENTITIGGVLFARR